MKNTLIYVSGSILLSFLLIACDKTPVVVELGPKQPVDNFFSTEPISTGNPLTSINFPITSLPTLSGTGVVNTDSAKLARKAIILQAVADMVYVDGGTFLMGATEEQGGDIHPYEKPAHQVTLTSYYISKFEVTRELYWYVVGGANQANATWLTANSDLKVPIEYRTYAEYQTFITKLNTLTGLKFTIPTEAQWEFAVRGGRKRTATPTMYAGGSSIDNVSCYLSNCLILPATTVIPPSLGMANTVGSKAANELGLYDMSGNMAEMCQDWYAPYKDSIQVNPAGSASLPTGTPQKRVVRGGSWLGTAEVCRTSARAGALSPSTRLYMVGLRLSHPVQ
jgi:formylglycine-generating enzyme required for sulfatase activity